jgi:adenylosuccinate lyase
LISRYSRQQMADIWSRENRFRIWQEIELLAVEAWAELGRIPQKSAQTIRQKAEFSVERIDELEKTTEHEVVAFVQALSERVGKEGRFLHLGLTSSDIMDTATSVQLMQSVRLLLSGLDMVLELLGKLATRYKLTPTVGRTHGIHAEPTTLGLVFANLWAELASDRKVLEEAGSVVSFGKLSGAVGTYSSLNPLLEKKVCQGLGLTPAPISSQILSRDRHAHFLFACALVASTLDRLAVEIRHRQRTEVGELFEPFGKGQKGSSAMPHKRNPVICERISGLARVIRANVQVGLENMVLWHERDISHSSAERVVLPDSALALDYILDKTAWVLEGLEVNEKRLKQNLELTRGLIFSSRVLSALVDGGMEREKAYGIVQEAAMKIYKDGGDFAELLSKNAEVMKVLGRDGLAECFDIKQNLRYVEEIFKRLGLG